LRDWKGGKGEQLVAGFLEAFGDRLAAQPPLACEGDPRLFHRRTALGVEHASIILGQFLAQMGRGLGEQIPELVGDRARKLINFAPKK
jgi:hypothetical protein